MTTLGALLEQKAYEQLPLVFFGCRHEFNRATTNGVPE